MSNTKTKYSIQPYLFFSGGCDEALKFYVAELGAEVMMRMLYKESPDPAAMHGFEDKVMHASFRIGDTVVLASDGNGEGRTDFKGFGLLLNAPTEADAERLFAALADGGEVQQPLAKTFFSPRFGMVTDRFGILWMVLVPAE